MSHPSEKWDRRFLELARHISQWSKDPSTKVGAVITQGKYVVGLGYNGFPVGVEDSRERLDHREAKYALVVHAEANAILMAAEKARGGTLYVYPSFLLPPVCNECAKLVIQAGIIDIVGYLPNPNDPRIERWRNQLNTAQFMCQEAGIKWRAYMEE